jgi:peptidyl-prolyl cis-trans isomerase B (cyclophilin B)
VPTNKQRRQAAQRHLQRQLERRAEQSRRRRRNLLIGATTLAVLVVAGAIVLVAGIGTGKPRTTPSASGRTSSSAAASTSADPSSCAYTKDASGNPNLKDVGTPPAKVPTSGTTAVTMTTNFGAIPLQLDRAGAPCATASMVYLAQKKFFDNTVCHRETSSAGLKVLQCGDPTGTGSGGPSYQYKTHVTGKETYKRGTIAMANSGQGFDGSQFFLVYGDSQLPPNYTVMGTITPAGLKVLDTIAANGIANGQSDGAPKKKVTITSMTVGATT